jgi:serine/threonine protein kinase
MFDSIVNSPIDFPQVGVQAGQVTQQARDFLEALLQKNPNKRLGATRGINELKEHAYFSDVNWKTLHKEPAPPAFVTSQSKKIDDSRFPKAYKEDEYLR